MMVDTKSDQTRPHQTRPENEIIWAGRVISNLGFFPCGRIVHLETHVHARNTLCKTTLKLRTKAVGTPAALAENNFEIKTRQIN